MDIGELHYCLRIIITYVVGESLELHPKHYIEKMLKNYQLEDVKPVSTPADQNVTLQKDHCVSLAVNPVAYQSLIWSLLYAAVSTRPNTSHELGVTLKFSSKPAGAHLTAVKRMYSYIKGSLDVDLKVQGVWICTANWIH